MPNSQLIDSFRSIVGKKNVLTREADTAYYRSGFRYGFGVAAAVVFLASPGAAYITGETIHVNGGMFMP